MERNIKLVIEYDGSEYCGWQRQNDRPTIQGTLEESVFQLTGERVTVHGAGRTDSGVHARGQVANFRTASKIPAASFARALNSCMPRDIVIIESCEVPQDFHAQFCAKTKAYTYHILCRSARPALEHRYVHWLIREPDVERMKKGAVYLVGKHDFTSFEAANSPRHSNVRTVHYLDVSADSGHIKISIEANGFLYRMVRNIAGTLIAVGHRQFEESHVEKILNAGDRSMAGPTAPAQGLFLEYIVY